MNRPDPVLRLQALVASAGTDAEAAAWAAAGLSAWLNFDGAIPMARCLGLPANPRDVRVRLRNRWLCEAGGMLDAPTPWGRAKRLLEATRHFESIQWPAWRNHHRPPDYATPLQRTLFFARQNAAFPETVRMFRNILSEME